MRICRLTLAVAALVSPAVAGEPTPPSGLYFHQFEGTFDGTEWATWGSLVDDGRYEFSDLTAAGTFAATIAKDGSILFDAGQGTGQFTSPDSASIDFTISGGFNFHSEIVRAPYTDERFPVFEAESIQGNQALAQTWNARVLDVNPETGATLAERIEQVEVLVEGTTVRITEQSGAYYQGVWFSEDQAGFRVIAPTPFNPRYRSFTGSETSLTQNIIGDLRVTDQGTMTFALFMQSRAPIGQQVQTMRYFELSQVPSPATGALLVFGGVVAARRRR